jgi:translocation and assembly module TamA
MLAACAGVPVEKRVEVAELEGAHGLDAGDILEGLQHHPPAGFVFVDYAAYEPLAIELDRRRIESYYRKRGWFSAKVVNVEIGKADEGVSVRFVVEEGRPSLLVSVDVAGAPPGLGDAVQSIAAKLKIGEPFDYGAYEETKAKMRQTLVSEGWVHAEIGGRAEVDRDRFEVRTFYSIDAGPAARFGAVSVEGLHLLPEEFVLDRAAFETGERFDPERLDVTRGRILETGLVESVRFGWDRERRTELVDLAIGVSEGPRNELRFGGGVGRSTGYQIRTLASYARKSLLDPLLTLRLTLKPSLDFLPNVSPRPSVEAALEFERQDVLWWPRLVGTLGVEYRLVQLEAYTTNGPSLSLGLGRPFFDDRLRVGVRLQYDHFDIAPRFEPKLEEEELRTNGILDPLRVLLWTPYVNFDARDNSLEPRFGWFAEVRAEIGEAFGLGSYATLTPDLRGYVPLGSRAVIAGRTRFGATLFREETVPITRRYFAGGPESQRGFGRRQLAPRLGAENLPVGGEALFETNVELRLDLFRLFGQWVGIVVFADGADARERVADLNPLDLHWAVGGGLRYRTPVGPIRFDLGVRVNRRDELDGPGWAPHFSLGEAF